MYDQKLSEKNLLTVGPAFEELSEFEMTMDGGTMTLGGGWAQLTNTIKQGAKWSSLGCVVSAGTASFAYTNYVA